MPNLPTSNPTADIAASRARRRSPTWPVDIAGALAAGVSYSVAFVHTGAWALQFALVAALAWRVSQVRPTRAAVIGWAFGLGWLAAGTWWLYISLHDHGGLPAVLAVAAVAGLSAALSLYLAAAMAVFSRWRWRRALPDALLFSACWTLAELARGILFTGFPWVASGYAQIDGPLAGLAPWVGVYGLGAAAAALSAAPAVASGMTSRAAGAVAACGVAAALAQAGPGDHTRTAGMLQVALIQTNVAQDDKFAVDRMPEALQWLSAQLLAARADLVVAPETAIPLLPADLGADYWQRLGDHFSSPDRAALIGRPMGSYEAGYTNSVSGLGGSAAAAEYRYDKHHLVPFGEFIPRGFHWFTEMMNIPLGDFARGPLVAPSFGVTGATGATQRVAPNICYEDLFGEELAARFADPATAPTVFANISNIAWFGDSSAIPQHLNISRMRTLEMQRPMIRATNTGATVVIDHQGRVTQALPPFTRGVLEARVEGRDGLTPYVRWVAPFGLWPLALASFVVVVSALLSARTRRPDGPEEQST